jgi:hypothetical protein
MKWPFCELVADLASSGVSHNRGRLYKEVLQVPMARNCCENKYPVEGRYFITSKSCLLSFKERLSV